MRSGDILVECTRQQQAVNLLKLEVLELPVSVTPHRSLNSSKGNHPRQRQGSLRTIRGRDLRRVRMTKV